MPGLCTAWKETLLNKYHCGFWMLHSTLGHLVHFETTVCEAFLKRQHCLSVFLFNLEKAYTALRYRILWDLCNPGVKS